MRKDINQVKHELLVLYETEIAGAGAHGARSTVERGDENNAASGHEIGTFSLPYRIGSDPGGAD